MPPQSDDPPTAESSVVPQGEEEKESATTFDSTSGKCTLFIIRHGDRWDYQHPEWRKTARRKGDPPLSILGQEQARQVGQFLDQMFVQEKIRASQITLLSSPFLRTVQTAHELLGAMKCINSTCTSSEDSITILPEYSVFEFDILGQDLHTSLPPDMEERKLYFPRLDSSYETMFVPSLPEDQSTFFQRCEESMKCISQKFDHQDIKQNRVIIVVTHAACCIGLVRAATGLGLNDINPASPCGIYKLTRSGDEEKWKIDHYSCADGFNGFTGHLENIGTSTKPWNHFGDKDVDDGYTGPSPDRF